VPALAHEPPLRGEPVRRSRDTALRATHPGSTERNTRGIAVANIVLGVALGIYTGVLLGALGARPLWNSPLLGPLFLVSGVSAGAAFMLLWPLHRSERALLGRADVPLITLELALIGLWLIRPADRRRRVTGRGATLILGGPYTAAFWTLVIVLGCSRRSRPALERRHGASPAGAALLVLALLVLRRRCSQHCGWILVAAGRWSARRLDSGR
jgi:protein NrfD